MCKLRFQTHVSESRWWFGDAFRLKQSYVHAAFICLGSLTAKADFVTLYQTRKSRAGSLHRYPRFQNNTTWPPRFEKVGSQCSLQTWTRASEHRANAHPELKAHRSDKHPIQSPPHPLQKTTQKCAFGATFAFPFLAKLLERHRVCAQRCLHIVTILIFLASAGPSVQGELRTKGLCSYGVPLPSSSHLPSDCAILWDCVSADTGSSGGISQSPMEQKKNCFFMALASLQEKNLFSSLQSRLSDLATVARGCLKFADVTEGALAPAGVFLHREEKCLQTPEKVVLELLLLTTLQRPGLSQSRTASNWQLFQRGEVTSVQMCLSSISCAHVYQCCPEITP